MTAPQLAMKDLRRVVIAAAVGNVIEWYDFYIFGSLATLLATKFFSAGASGSALIGYVPSYAQIGALAGVLLLLLRLIQGLCLGGEYGGAITYVAEHAPDEKRGYYTGW